MFTYNSLSSPLLLNRDFSRRPLHNIASTNVPSTATPGKHVRTPNVALAPVTPGRAAATQKRAFQSQKRSLAEQLLGEFNRVVFGGKLPPLTLNWSQTLNKTAGRAHCTAIGPAGAIEVEADSGDENSKNVTGKHSSVAAESSTRTYRVELSTKVIDDEQRLRMTLAHELCHIAVWHLHGLDHPPHGKLFMGYGARFSRHYDDIVVTRLHSYDIAFKYQYVCTNADGCGKVYGRHSKSIDVARKCCGVCRGRLELATKTKADGTPLKANPYREFVKANFGVVREELQSRMSSSTGARKIAHGEVMSELAQRWRAFKMSNGTAL